MDARRQLSRVGWCYVVFILIYMAVSYFVSLVIFISFFRYDMRWYDDNVSMLLADVVMYVVAFPVFWLMMRTLPSWKKQKTESISGRSLVRLFFVCLGVTYLGNDLGQALMSAIGEAAGMDMLNPVAENIAAMDVWAVFVVTVLIAPVMEELMFRKMLIDRLVPFGQKTAVLLSAISFGLFHGNFYQFFYAAALGFIFAYLYSSTGRLRYSVLLHMGINLVGGVVPVLLEEGLRSGSPFAAWGETCLLLLMVISMAAAVFQIIRHAGALSWFPAWERPENGIFLEILRAPGIWAFFLVSGALFFIG
ncbi:MAG: CPBP family intramembrane metalloprotease [Clostridiales bacterium]|nr:CPBP family intramembrane metalloprotease [Clostridiales bacterium]